ncbi:hypothetical protein M422DRAFT_153091 [Sphaerobolus stellatus SS14]|nr:hypothetical protein M422DRAFT_153091 [Sphaerobolus stellatus SS14]
MNDFLRVNNRPFIDLSEQGNEYIVEAEVPGVKKENLEVRIGSNGRNTPCAVVVKAEDQPTAISTERDFWGASYFARTIWLPQAVDGKKVNAQLKDGILTLRIPKIENEDSVYVNIG